MNKAIFVATLCVMAPLSALAQQTQQRPMSGPQEMQQRGAQDTQRSMGGGTLGEADKGGSARSEETGREDFLDNLANSALRERVSRAVEIVGTACEADIDELCGDVEQGKGRIARCLKDNAEELSPRCRLALHVVARRIANTVRQFANTCMSDVESKCSQAENVAQCVAQNKESFSPECKVVVAALKKGAQTALTALKGMPVFSADDKNLGQVVEVVKGPDGKVQAVQIQVGRFLGIGDKVVVIDANKIQQLADRLKLRLDSDEVRALPQAKKTPQQ